jgi:hypothetical protein
MGRIILLWRVYGTLLDVIVILGKTYSRPEEESLPHGHVASLKIALHEKIEI